MGRFALLVAYDGTEFHGWQRQPGVRTVQGVIETAIREATGETPSDVAAAGRTDAGVHARGQVMSLAIAAALPARAVPHVVNRRLPADVRIRAAREVHAEFHARRSARARRYSYRLLRRPDLLGERFAWHPGRPLAAERLAAATGALEGEADFSAFRAAGGSPGPPVCRIFRTGWRTSGNVVRFDILASRFLYRMVRNIVGTAVEVSGGQDPAAAMRAILESRSRGRAAATAPPHGLCLERVYYSAGGKR
jgi:tRNA pseudouridine38-40 synthase